MQSLELKKKNPTKKAKKEKETFEDEFFFQGMSESPKQTRPPAATD